MSEYLTYLRRGQEIIRLAQAEMEINVTAARILGDSWQSIGDALGMSRQAAQQRFGTTRERAQIPGQATIDEAHED
jgi:hypothetical protein